MKKVYLLFLLLFSLDSNSQEHKKWSIEASYPIPIDDNFIGKNYNGIIDVGTKYRLMNKEIINVGFAINGAILKSKFGPYYSNDITSFRVTNFVIQPKVFAEFNINREPAFRPFVGLGYTFMIFKSNGMLNGYDLSNHTENLNGFNINIGASYDITKRFFIQALYDFTKVNLENGALDITYNTNVNILKLGVGVNL